MDFKKFDLLLKKINTLKQNMDLSGDDVSKLEIDLLKNYIRQMYELVALPDTEVSLTAHPKPKSAEVVVEKRRRTELEEVTEPVVKIEKPAEFTPAVEAVKEEKKLPQTPAVVELVQQTPVAEVVSAPEPVAKAEEKSEQNLTADMAEIFSSDPSSDLSDKLSSAPLEDIKKAIAINDRILTTNDLFGGNKDLLEETLSFVNKAENFEAAKNWIISHVAVPNKWMSADKKGKAKRFIKLVRRRLPE